MNLFANDGSFLDQFKKIANKGSGKQEMQQDKFEDRRKDEKNHESTRERDRHRHEKNRDWDSRRDRIRSDSRWGRNSDRKHSSSSSPSPTRRRTPPSPEIRRSYNQPQNGQRTQFNQQFPIQNNNQISSIPSLMSQPIQMQITNIPPPNLRNLTSTVPSAPLQRLSMSKNFNNNYTNINDHSNNVNMQIAPSHIIHPPPPPPSIQNIPPNTNIPPPNMRISQAVPISNLSSSNGQQHIIQNPQCNISPLACSANLQSPNIPPPNIPPPNILPPMSQMQPTMLPITGSQTIVVTVPNVANIPPPNVITSMIMSSPPPVHTVPSTINSIPPPNLNIPPPTVIPNTTPTRALMSTGYTLSNQMPITVGPPNVQIPPPVRPPPTNLQNSEQGMVYLISKYIYILVLYTVTCKSFRP